jgi:dipeptidyl aminopeptidase/acylaminoacyl peptidase
LYPGEGHGWRKVETVAAYYAEVETFLAEHVLYA